MNKRYRWTRTGLWTALLSTATAALIGCAGQSNSRSENVAPADAATAAAKTPIEVVSAQFGVFGVDHGGRRLLLETNRFPAVTAAPFGWYVVFKTAKPTVVWREEFELPQAPPTWGPGEALGVFSVSPDRKTAVTERVIPTRVGFIANEWRYAPGDPIGAHKMRIYIDGALVREFSFSIEEGPGSREGGVLQPQRRGISTWTI